jgi:hypothetical protein
MLAWPVPNFAGSQAASAPDGGRIWATLSNAQNISSTAVSARSVTTVAERSVSRKRMSVVGLRNVSLEFYGILLEFVIYWTSLAVASWIGLII